MMMQFLPKIILVVFAIQLNGWSIIAKKRIDFPASKCTDTYDLWYTHTYIKSNSRHQIKHTPEETTLRECQEKCNEEKKCRGVGYIIRSGDILEYRCELCSNTLKELRPREGERQIYYNNVHHQIYDRNCQEVPCTSSRFEVSHNYTRPSRKYKIKIIRATTLEKCQEHCNNEDNCRSVNFFKSNYNLHMCTLCRMPLQEVIDTRNTSEIFYQTHTIYYTTFITFDRNCECPPGHEPSNDCEKMSCKPCSAGFFKVSNGSEKFTECEGGQVSRESTSCECPPGQEPSNNYDKVSCKPCSAGFFKVSNGSEKCTECVNGQVSRDKTSCAVGRSDRRCLSGSYDVSHSRKRPGYTYIIGVTKINVTRNDSARDKTCQEICDGEDSCRSVNFYVTYELRSFCLTFNISVQELIDTRNEREIIYGTNTTFYTRYITYDRNCDSTTTTPTTTTPKLSTDCSGLSGDLKESMYCLPIKDVNEAD